MLGRTHAVTAATAWLGVAPPLALTPGQVALGAVLAAGAGMAPDTDMPRSHIGRTYGPVTSWPCQFIERVSGGHRQGTHSFVGVAAFTAAAVACEQAGGWPRGILIWILLGAACRALDIAIPGHQATSAGIHAVTMGAVTLLVLDMDTSLVLPAVMLVGCVIHLAGDCLTEERCPLLWPLSKRRVGVGLAEVGGWVEPAVTTVCVLAAGWLLLHDTPAGVQVGARVAALLG